MVWYSISASSSAPSSTTVVDSHIQVMNRGNFLELLRAGHGDYAVNAEALAYMRQRALAGPLIARLGEHPDRFFPDRAAWTAHLDRLGISALEVTPDPVTIATELENARWIGSA
jgi:hypothetical protein